MTVVVHELRKCLSSLGTISHSSSQFKNMKWVALANSQYWYLSRRCSVLLQYAKSHVKPHNRFTPVPKVRTARIMNTTFLVLEMRRHRTSLIVHSF